ncbi:2,4-dihydroxyhept-2-ene-1,7-dioic acid aldolase [Gulosibacter sp. 10]|nr:2,4-dihydroxyhept-2-ene-1,7-dioic acid aldolase [Gulosibacter sp. 10]
MRAGFSWVMVDLEHGIGDEGSLVPMLWATRAAGGYALVRVASHDPARIARVLDLGADAIMLPSVDTAEQARRIVAAATWPPHGERGVSLQSRAGDYGSLSHAEVSNQDRRPYVVVQIETPEGLRNVREIAAVDGVSALFLGPTDLTHSMGIPGRFDVPEFREAVAAVAKSAAEAGKTAAVLAADAVAAERYREDGYSLIAIGSDGGYLKAKAQSVLADVG